MRNHPVFTRKEKEKGRWGALAETQPAQPLWESTFCKVRRVFAILAKDTAAKWSPDGKKTTLRPCHRRESRAQTPPGLPYPTSATGEGPDALQGGTGHLGCSCTWRTSTHTTLVTSMKPDATGYRLTNFTSRREVFKKWPRGGHLA